MESLSLQYGLCYYCDGPVEESVCLPGEPDAPDWFDDAGDEEADGAAIVNYQCQRCGERIHSMVEIAIVTNPAVMGFHYEHGIDLRETPIWALPWLDGAVARTVSEDPVHIEVPVELDDERRVFTFDRDLDVVETIHG